MKTKAPKIFWNVISVTLLVLAVGAVALVFILGAKFRPAQKAHAGSNITWTNGSGDHNWFTGTNWSGGVVPGPADVAIFSASSTANSTLNGTVDVGGITITSGYTGTITQQTGSTLTVESLGWTQAGGTFTGSSARDDITLNGPFSQTGGVFTATNGDLYLYGPSTFMGTFQNNSGTVHFATTVLASSTASGTTSFYDLWLGDGLSVGTNTIVTIATGTMFTVNGSTTFGYYASWVYLEGGGTIDAKGDVEDMDYAGPGDNLDTSSTFNLILNGTGTQNILASLDNNDNVAPFYLPSVTINKASGVVNLVGSVGVVGNWINDDGVAGVSAGTSTILFSGVSSTIQGSSTFYDFELGLDNGHDNGNSSNTVTVATGTVITVESSTLFGPNYYRVPLLLGGGQLDAQGNILLDFPEDDMPTSPPFNFVLTGTSTQLIGDNGWSPDQPTTNFYLPSLTVNKPSGVAIISSARFEIPNSLSITQGELQVASGTATSSLEVDGPVSISGGAVFSAYPGTSSTIALGSSVTNNGLVFFDGSLLACTASLPYGITINSTTTGSQIPWSGSGNFVMRYINVTDQGGTAPISVWNGLPSGGDVGGNWTFVTEPEPQLIQSSTANGGSGTTNLALPAFGFKTRAGDLVLVAVSARNQTISAPTDNASDTYTLVAASNFGSSPSYAVSLYYARNIMASSSFTVTAHGSGGSGQMLSASAFEYTGVAPSSTFATYSANTPGAAATALTSLSAVGQTNNELYFGVGTVSASTTATPNSPWTGELGVSNNSTRQALYTEDIATTSPLTIDAEWTAATSTNYGAIIGVFRSPYSNGYVASGTLDSATFDTGVTGGAQLNSLIWQGSVPVGGNWGGIFPVGFQIAVSNSSSGPWNFEGPSGDTSLYFKGNPGTPIELDSSSGGLTMFNGYRYFRYRVVLFPDTTNAYSPSVSQVTVDWSP